MDGERSGLGQPGKPTLAVLINARARGVRKQPALARNLQEIFGSTAIVRCTERLDEADDALRIFHESGADIVAICGGDGSIGWALSGLARLYCGAPLPALALLRGGTMNTIARGTGLPRRSPETLARALLGACRGRRDFVQQRRASIRVGSRVGMLFGTGLAVQYLDRYYRAGKGHPRASTAARALATLVFESLLNPRSRAAERMLVDVDGTAVPPRSYLAVLAGTLAELGLGFRAFPQTDSDRHELAVLALHGSPRELALRLGPAWRGGSLGSGCSTRWSARRLILTPNNASLRYFLDGDLFCSPSPLRVELGPPVRFLRG